MDSHQRAMWNRMIERVATFNIKADDLGALVCDLRGLFVEADLHDASMRSDFESHWAPIDGEHELRTEPWAPKGSADDRALTRSLAAFEAWAQRVIQADLSSDHR